MVSRYKDFVRLLERWPLDPTKAKRDIAEHIRNQIKIAFDSEGGFTGDPKNCERQYNSLKTIVDNYYGSLYKRNKPFTATGLTAEECKLLLSNESLTTLEKEYTTASTTKLWKKTKEQ